MTHIEANAKYQQITKYKCTQQRLQAFQLAQKKTQILTDKVYSKGLRKLLH